MINEAMNFINERIAVHALKGSIEVEDYVPVKFFNSEPSLRGHEKEKNPDAAGGILEDMSVITNKIRQLATFLTEASAPPEIEPPPSEAA